jgi:hypothetical protein
MQSEPDDHPKRQNTENLKEYRTRLLQKLNCLIAVLQVAIAKVRRNLEAPSADLDRLTRIRTNLEKTLNICRKAKASLENSSSLPSDLPAGLSSVVGLPPRGEGEDPPEEEAREEDAPIFPALQPPQPKAPKMSYRHYVEFSSLEEFKRFRDLPPLSRDEVEEVDIDDLTRRLQEG